MLYLVTVSLCSVFHAIVCTTQSGCAPAPNIGGSLVVSELQRTLEACESEIVHEQSVKCEQKTLATASKKKVQMQGGGEGGGDTGRRKSSRVRHYSITPRTASASTADKKTPKKEGKYMEQTVCANRGGKNKAIDSGRPAPRSATGGDSIAGRCQAGWSRTEGIIRPFAASRDL